MRAEFASLKDWGGKKDLFNPAGAALSDQAAAYAA